MEFKKINAIIRKGHLEKVEAALEAYGIKGLTVTKIKGFGEYANFFERDWMCEHARIEIFASVGEVESIVKCIMEAAHTGNQGDGIMAVLPVETVYRIRTRQAARAEEI
ncbi:P-II family nitrogen regulator [bacterium]|nr:P-II family nitrogen regulator [bacterium]